VGCNFEFSLIRLLVPAFKNILLPVDFTSNTELALKKAIDLVDKEDSVIHLIHILKSGKGDIDLYQGKIGKLRNLKIYLNISVPGILVETHLCKSISVEKAIIEKAGDFNAELIIIARQSGKKLFSLWKTVSPSRLAKKTRCAVLTLKPGSEYSKIKSIVVPFRSHIPRRKLDVLVPLTWKKNTIVYLVAMLNELKEFEIGDSSVTHTLIETYRLLREDLNCQIIHKLVTGSNIAKSMLRFAESVDADVLLANPDEMSISSLTGLDISDRLGRDSKMQLLTIEPESYYPV
jgi:nucleotide-binding universal stress UspA family protein